jgi:hypothetical protein
MGGMIAAAVLCLFRLGAITIFRARRVSSEFQGSKVVAEGKKFSKISGLGAQLPKSAGVSAQVF